MGERRRRNINDSSFSPSAFFLLLFSSVLFPGRDRVMWKIHRRPTRMIFSSQQKGLLHDWSSEWSTDSVLFQFRDPFLLLLYLFNNPHRPDDLAERKKQTPPLKWGRCDCNYLNHTSPGRQSSSHSKKKTQKKEFQFDNNCPGCFRWKRRGLKGVENVFMLIMTLVVPSRGDILIGRLGWQPRNNIRKVVKIQKKKSSLAKKTI